MYNFINTPNKFNKSKKSGSLESVMILVVFYISLDTLKSRAMINYSLIKMS